MTFAFQHLWLDHPPPEGRKSGTCIKLLATPFNTLRLFSTKTYTPTIQRTQSTTVSCWGLWLASMHGMEATQEGFKGRQKTDDERSIGSSLLSLPNEANRTTSSRYVVPIGSGNGIKGEGGGHGICDV